MRRILRRLKVLLLGILAAFITAFFITNQVARLHVLPQVNEEALRETKPFPKP